MATSYIVFAILCSTALGEFDVENLPAVEPTATTEGAKLDDSVKDSSRALEECNNDLPASCQISGGPFTCTTLLHHLEELEEEKYRVDEFCGLSWSYIDGCSDTPGLVKDTCNKFCGNCVDNQSNSTEQCRLTCMENAPPCNPGCKDDPPVTCKEGEERCGEKPRNPTADCSRPLPDEICAPEDCECPRDGCEEVICPVDCTSGEEIPCSQNPDSNGCQKNDVCVEITYGTDNTTCEGICEVALGVECEDNQLLCPTENLPNGCEQPNECINKQRGKDGRICEKQHCPFNCPDRQHWCEYKDEESGCKDPKCVPCEINEEGECCPGTCPVGDCKPPKIKCEGEIVNGCRGQDACHDKAKDYEGVFCPPDSASHLCPKTCGDNDVLCPPVKKPNGCLGPYECKTKSTGNNGDDCPSESVCPLTEPCKPNEIECQGGYGEDGCKLPDECIKGGPGPQCTAHCPPTCDPDEQIICKGIIDEYGCRGKGECIDKGEHKWGPGSESEPKEKCPGFCPAQCEANEILCPSQTDPCNGCPTGEVCHLAVPDKKGKFCPGKQPGSSLSYSHGCAKLCKDNEVLCSQIEEENGCKPEAECVRKVKNDKDEWCPSHSVCRKEFCPKGHLLCDYEDKDSNGCRVESKCIYKGKKENGLYCKGFCPPVCGFDETLGEHRFDADGCKIQSFCVPNA